MDCSDIDDVYRTEDGGENGVTPCTAQRGLCVAENLPNPFFLTVAATSVAADCADATVGAAPGDGNCGWTSVVAA